MESQPADTGAAPVAPPASVAGSTADHNNSETGVAAHCLAPIVGDRPATEPTTVTGSSVVDGQTASQTTTPAAPPAAVIGNVGGKTPADQVLLLQTLTNKPVSTTIGIQQQQLDPSQLHQQNLLQFVNQNGHTFHNGLLNLTLAGTLRDDCDALHINPEEVASISDYSSVSSPEILSPNPGQLTPEIPTPDTYASDTQLSLVHRAEDLHINGQQCEPITPWVFLGKREPISADNTKDKSDCTTNGAAVTSVQNGGVFDPSGAITSPQFIFTQFGTGVAGAFTPTTQQASAGQSQAGAAMPSRHGEVTTTNNTVTTKICAIQQTDQRVSTPPAKRLKQPCLSLPHTAKVGPYELKIISQPEEQHRARYLTEGSRGAVKDRTGSTYPTVQLLGYKGNATLQVFVGCDSGKVKPHGFYQACKVYGKSSNQFEEREIDGTSVIEIAMEMNAEMEMKTCIDCVGILKLRNADVEARVGPIRSKKRSNRARLVFRVTVPKPDGSTVTLQVASQPILCTQPVGQPEICRMSRTSAPYNGGVDLFLVGKNFLKGSKVLFRETSEAEEVVWEKEAQIDPEFFHQMHIICTIPCYDRATLREPLSVQVVVDSAGRASEGYHFSYLPGSTAVATQTTPAVEPWSTIIQTAVPNVTQLPSVQCVTGADKMAAMKMDTEMTPVKMETNAMGSITDLTATDGATGSVPPASLFPLQTILHNAPPAQVSQPINTPSGGQHNIGGLDEDSPTTNKPPGMLMDSDPMVSSTCLGVTPPSVTAAYPLANDSMTSSVLPTNDMYLQSTDTVATNHAEKTNVYADERKHPNDSESWSNDSSDNKMEVSHEPYKPTEQWTNPNQWHSQEMKTQIDSNFTTDTKPTDQWTNPNQWNPTEMKTPIESNFATESAPSWTGNDVTTPAQSFHTGTNATNSNTSTNSQVAAFADGWNRVNDVTASVAAENHWPTAPSSEHGTNTAQTTDQSEQLQFSTQILNSFQTSNANQCAPEMAMAPKEFSTSYANTSPQSTNTTFQPVSEANPQTVNATVEQVSNKSTGQAVLENQSVIFANEHGQHRAVLLSAEDLVKDAHTILSGQLPNTEELLTGNSSTIQQSPVSGTTDFGLGHISGTLQAQANSNPVHVIYTEHQQSVTPTTVAADHLPPITTAQLTPALANHTTLQDVHPGSLTLQQVNVTSAAGSTATYVIVTGQQHQQTAAAAPALVDALSHQMVMTTQLQQTNLANQQGVANTVNNESGAESNPHQPMLIGDQSPPHVANTTPSLGHQQQQQQPLLIGNSDTNQQNVAHAQSMVLGGGLDQSGQQQPNLRHEQSQPMVIGGAGGDGRARNESGNSDKDGLSGGSLPTISVHDVCDILWDESL